MPTAPGYPGAVWFCKYAVRDTIYFMQAIILAAGRGTRMEELTSRVPKPLLLVGGKPLLGYKLDAMPEAVDEVIVIVGYMSDAVRDRFGMKHDRLKLTYVEQKELNGTADALWQAKDLLKDRFIVLNADDIFDPEDLARCAEEFDGWKLLVQQVEHLRRAGDVRLDENVHVDEIVEGDRHDEPGLASTNAFVLDTRLFTQPLVPMREGNLEYGLPQTVVAAAKALGITIEPVFTSNWIQVNYPSDLVRAEETLKKIAQEKAEKEQSGKGA